MKKILVLGAGLVAGPAVRYLLEQQDIEVVLADQVADKARMLIRDCLLYTSPSPRDLSTSRMPSSA